MKYKKYGEVFLLVLVLLAFFSMLVTLFGYFNILSEKVTQLFILFSTMLTLFLGGIYLGKKCEKKGWFEGIKIGILMVVFFFLISYLGLDQGINLKSFLYYIILIASSMLGSMLGINRKEEN